MDSDVSARAVADHLDHLRLLNRQESTVIARGRALARLQAKLTVPLLEAGPDELMAWRRSLRKLVPDTIAQYVSHTQEFYRWATRAGWIPADPSTALPVPQLGHRVPRPITEQRLIQALAGASPRIRPWLVLAGWAGLRAKEIALLRREHVLDTVTPPVLIVAQSATKGRNERIVPLSRFVLAELAAAGLPASGYCFRRMDGSSGPNTPQIVSQLANQCLHDQGITETLHQLRHRFGTKAYQVDRDLRAVQAIMGHARPQTTALYADFDPGAAIAAVEGLPVPGLRAVE